MKSIFLPVVVPVLLVTLGFGQNPAPPSSTDQASIKGCLGGSEGNYTVAENGTAQTFRIASSTVDLKPHLGHDVEVIGQKANVSASSEPSDNSVIVTGVNMISDHCATATASAPVVADPATPATASTPVVADPAPAVTASTPVVADATPAATPSTPAVAASAPAPAEPAAMATEPASAPKAAKATPATSTETLPDTASALPLLGFLGLGLLGMGLVIRRVRTH